MKFRELLEYIDDNNKIQVIGIYKYGLVDMYKGEVKPLKEILKISDILEFKKWGLIYEDNCFLKRDVNSISNGDLANGLFVSIRMPDSYENKDINGERLNQTLEIK